MGIREVFHQLDRDEIRALPYVSAALRTKIHNQELIRNQSRPPTVYKIPETWTICVSWVLILYYMGFVKIILSL